MTFPRYPEYKPSGVEWLGEVPSHWEVVPLGKLTRSKCDGPFGSGLKSEHYVEDGVRVVRLQNIRAGMFDGADAAFIDTLYYERELAGHDVRAGDVLIAGLGDDNNLVGRACVAPSGIEPAMVKADCFRFRVDASRLLPEHAARALTVGASADAGRLGTGTTRTRIPLSVTATRKITLPPIDEQHAIAEFLDRETAKIDALVVEQERLIELLKEKRQAVISHAVTKGLNPDAPMKDSGVEWLGAVPAHWHVVRVKDVVASIGQGWSPQCEGRPADLEREWGVLKVGCVNTGAFDPLENKALPSDLEPDDSLAITAGDVLISRANTRELVGRAAVAESEYPRLLLCDKLYRLRLRTSCAPAFLAGYLRGAAARAQIELGATGASSSMQNIGQATILNLPIALPPPAEQSAIVTHLERVGAGLASLATEAAGAISLLQERRTALITAAVTGQIDVRKHAARSAA